MGLVPADGDVDVNVRQDVDKEPDDQPVYDGVGLAPDVLKVIALAQSRDDRQPAPNARR